MSSSRSGRDFRPRPCARGPRASSPERVLLVYLGANVALLFFMQKYSPNGFKPVTHAVLPAIGAASIIVPLYYLSKPGQAAPYDWYPYIALAILVASIAYATYLTRRDPSLATRVGSIIADH
jgi:hypothetical protein